MQTYDLVMLAVLGFATIFGFWKGLAWQVASLASLVVAQRAAETREAPLVARLQVAAQLVVMLVAPRAASSWAAAQRAASRPKRPAA